ncbi:MAG TPA: hypothetical protein DCF63_10260 [Planctomycetaceae bacterium]|nr:hypothetical protein [Planctomycetaceae bacterium]
MISRRDGVLLVAFFVLGLLVAWQFTKWNQARLNTPERIAQRLVNAGLEKDVCERVKSDLSRFKDEPNTFRRTSFQAIENESRSALRYLLKSRGVPDDFPIAYRGSGSAYEKCRSELRTWMDIPSAGSQNLTQELMAAGLAVERAGSGPRSASEPQAFEAGRLALVIGNSNYRNRPLINPRNDADDVSALLKKSGFEVIDLRDGDLRSMNAAASEFTSRLKSSSAGFVYYSGHGIEHRGRNYLLPVDAQINNEDEIPRQALDASSLVERASRAERNVKIFVIDACRSSFVPSRQRSATQGLARMEGAQGTIVAFSTAPGTVAEDGNDRNSPYTKNLLVAMAVPGRKIEDVFKETARRVEIETGGRQVPWYNSSLLVDWSIH